MRRLHLRHRDNISKRLLIHAGGFNLSLMMRKLTGLGTPRGRQGLVSSLFDRIWRLWIVLAFAQTESDSSEARARILVRPILTA